MPSSYTTSGIELIGDGEQSGSWGNTTNTNLEIIDRLTSQAGAIALSGTTHTLSLSDGTLSDGQYAVLVFGGAPSGTNTVTISPNDAKRVFIVKNNSGQSVVLTQGSGGNVTIIDGKTAIVYCDGAGSSAAVVDVSSTFVSGTIADIGALTPTDGNFIVGNGTTWIAEAGNTVLNSLGVTATATELNTMDGITATTTELNVLDGITATTAELNYTDGVTSNIQTQLDTKAAQATTLTAGTGLTGGGDLSTNRTISAEIATQAEAEAGTVTDKLMTPQRTKQAIEALSPGWDFTSSSTTISRPQTTIAHGLGAVPSRFFVTMKCITTYGEFAVGDEIPINSYSFQAGSAPEKFGFNWYADDTYIYINVGSSGVRYVASNGDYASYDFSYFNYIARASL